MATVSIVEDDVSFRFFLTRALSCNVTIRILSMHDNAQDALREIPRLRPDVVLMDIKMPGMDGIECTRQLKAIKPPLPTRVLILTQHQDSDLVFNAMTAGASGYVVKDPSSFVDLPSFIHEVARGDLAMSPGIERMVIERVRAPGAAALRSLSQREMEVLTGLAEGLANKEISKLYISVDTVKHHLEAIYSRLPMHSRAQATRQRFDQEPKVPKSMV